jgi:hypothetical protein
LTRTPTITAEKLTEYEAIISEKLPDYDYASFGMYTVHNEGCSYNEEPEISTKLRLYGKTWDDYLLGLKEIRLLSEPLFNLKTA